MINIHFQQDKVATEHAGFVSVAAADEARRLHEGLPGYTPTPLVALDALAGELGVAQLLVKDESKRLGLNAFKGLGGSYALTKQLCERFGIPVGRDTIATLRSEPYASQVAGLTAVTATDGNHGRGVAWSAQQLGCKAVVYLPAGTVPARLENIRALGAEASITNMNYDDTVRHAAQMAGEHGWILVQDTAWEGYEVIPADIMRGYTTLAAEVAQQLDQAGWQAPTHLFLQAGVGSFAAAMAGYFASLWGATRPKIVVVEPDRADCLYRTAMAADGQLHVVTGALDSVMAGLCCGEPSTLAWPILSDLACAFVSCDDPVALEGVRLLGEPLAGDPAIESGESGAATAGVLAALMRDPALADARERLGLGADSRVLLVSTEGNTATNR